MSHSGFAGQKLVQGSTTTSIENCSSTASVPRIRCAISSSMHGRVYMPCQAAAHGDTGAPRFTRPQYAGRARAPPPAARCRPAAPPASARPAPAPAWAPMPAFLHARPSAAEPFPVRIMPPWQPTSCTNGSVAQMQGWGMAGGQQMREATWPHLHDVPQAVLAGDREGEEEAGRDAVRAVAGDAHGDPLAGRRAAQPVAHVRADGARRRQRRRHIARLQGAARAGVSPCPATAPPCWPSSNPAP